MATTTRTDSMLLRNLLGVVLLVGIASLGQAAEAEIYVTTGPDGIEIFSNLPRGPVTSTSRPLPAAQNQVAIVSTIPAHQPLVATPEMQQQSELLASGKSFLLDD